MPSRDENSSTHLRGSSALFAGSRSLSRSRLHNFFIISLLFKMETEVETENFALTAVSRWITVYGVFSLSGVCFRANYSLFFNSCRLKRSSVLFWPPLNSEYLKPWEKIQYFHLFWRYRCSWTSRKVDDFLKVDVDFCISHTMHIALTTYRVQSFRCIFPRRR